MANNTERLKFNRPALFSPNVVRQIKENAANSVFFEKSDSTAYADLAIGETSSFKYDLQQSGLKSTQQLNVDYSDFANHTFFNSAQVKTNVALDKIINEFPFDGTKKEIEIYFDKLTGFEKYVYDQFQKNKGYLFFSGVLPSEGGAGTQVIVKDVAGAQFLTLSKLKTGQTVLDPGLNSMTIEMQLFVPSQSNGNLSQTILNKQRGNNGFSIVLESSTGSLTSSVSMMVVSGVREDKVSLSVAQNAWNHVHWTWDRTPGIHTIYGYLNSQIQASSSSPFEFLSLNTGPEDLIIGSGSNIGSFVQNSTFSGSIDELRIWHSVRTQKQREEFLQKSVYTDSNLKLYFKFNEPSGSNTNLVLDYSGNSLHGKLNNFGLVHGVRNLVNASGRTPMNFERLEWSPVLFPNVDHNVDLRNELLLSASNFDLQNPNIITNLIPRHYFIEGQHHDGLQTEEGTIVDAPTGEQPGELKLGSTQVLLSLLYVWAKFFDEMKLYIQAFSNLNRVDYDIEDTIPNDFLSAFARREGIELPPLFSGASIEQYIEGENLQGHYSTNILGLQSVQNEIWRRILINLQDVLKSKGTIHAIKAYIRALGVDPDSNFRIREHGGPTKSPISFNREKRLEVATLMNFISGGLLLSPPLSGTRIEPGYPQLGPDSENNALFTSGSFTYEGIYKFPRNEDYLISQSLVRLELSTSTNLRNVLANVVAKKNPATLSLFVSPDNLPSADTLTLEITGANIFDGKQWNISFGRIRNDDAELNSNVSSSYFLRATQQNQGSILENYSVSSFFTDFPSTSKWQTTDISTFGPIVAIGSSSAPIEASTYLTGTYERTQDFQGKVGQIRFWSRHVTNKEWQEHVKNYRSVGVNNPKANFNFVTNVSSSFGRLRIDASTDQIITKSNSSGEIQLTDFTQNNFHLVGTDFPPDKKVIEPEQFYFSYISPKIDEGVSENKVRIRSFQSFEKFQDTPWSEIAPVHEINPYETPSDSTKLSIDFSIVDALDLDIITIFSSLDELNNILGDPELQFAASYKGLEIIREIYFKKLQGKINIKGFFEYYKWFDTNIGTFVEQLMPRKTKFLGTNFVIESHMLERNKVQYQFEDIYLGEDIRSGLRDTILLQLIEGKFQRF